MVWIWVLRRLYSNCHGEFFFTSFSMGSPIFFSLLNSSDIKALTPPPWTFDHQFFSLMAQPLTPPPLSLIAIFYCFPKNMQLHNCRYLISRFFRPQFFAMEGIEMFFLKSKSSVVAKKNVHLFQVGSLIFFMLNIGRFNKPEIFEMLIPIFFSSFFLDLGCTIL